MAHTILDPLEIAAVIGHAVSDARFRLPEAVADGLLADLTVRARDAGADPGEVARLAVLDLAASLVAFGAVRTLGELMGWIGREAPARIVELMASADLAELPPLSARSAPQPASWN
jgi:hypothetical protein